MAPAFRAALALSKKFSAGVKVGRSYCVERDLDEKGGQHLFFLSFFSFGLSNLRYLGTGTLHSAEIKPTIHYPEPTNALLSLVTYFVDPDASCW